MGFQEGAFQRWRRVEFVTGWVGQFDSFNPDPPTTIGLPDPVNCGQLVAPMIAGEIVTFHFWEHESASQGTGDGSSAANAKYFGGDFYATSLWTGMVGIGRTSGRSTGVRFLFPHCGPTTYIGAKWVHDYPAATATGSIILSASTTFNASGWRRHTFALHYRGGSNPGWSIGEWVDFSPGGG